MQWVEFYLKNSNDKTITWQCISQTLLIELELRIDTKSQVNISSLLIIRLGKPQ